mmetsp:Transcript_26583/g.73095  ORF Transcript_26583/g.73095 Transcript_26583/m.73095 type:complete len:257 (+) Transcript_26583:1875-2645(+)
MSRESTICPVRLNAAPVTGIGMSSRVLVIVAPAFFLQPKGVRQRRSGILIGNVHLYKRVAGMFRRKVPNVSHVVVVKCLEVRASGATCEWHRRSEPVGCLHVYGRVEVVVFHIAVNGMVFATAVSLFIRCVFKEKTSRILLEEFVENLELKMIVPGQDAVNPRLDGSFVQYQGRIGILLVYLLQVMVLRKEDSQLHGHRILRSEQPPIFQQCPVIIVAELSRPVDFGIDIVVTTTTENGRFGDEVFKDAAAHQFVA